jgi:hypothetical protein
MERVHYIRYRNGDGAPACMNVYLAEVGLSEEAGRMELRAKCTTRQSVSSYRYTVARAYCGHRRSIGQPSSCCAPIAVVWSGCAGYGTRCNL